MMTLWSDPVLHATIQLGCGALLLRAAYHKGTSPERFVAAIEGYRLVPRAFTRVAAGALGLCELAVGIALLVPGSGDAAALAGSALLLGYAAAMTLAWVRGDRDVDCGCTAPGVERPIGLDLVLRNAVLAGLLLATAGPAAARAVTWLDVLSITAGVVTAGFLFIASEHALSHGARSAHWRDSP